MSDKKHLLPNRLVTTEHPVQVALCRLLEGTNKVDVDELTQALLPVILAERSLEDLGLERARQIVGQLITKLTKVTPDGEAVPAFLKVEGDNYKPIEDVTVTDLRVKQAQLNQRRSGLGVQIEKLTDVGEQLDLPGMSEFEAEKDYDSEAEHHFLQEAKVEGLELTHNKEVGRYRIDFSVVEDGQPTRCNISILGEKWHKNKLPHDFARMRDLTKEGELMIPFTARQVFSDPSKCISEVKSIFTKWRQALAG